MAGRSYSAWTVSATAPLGERVLLKGAYSRLSDWNTASLAQEGLSKLSLGAHYSFSKRTRLFLSQSLAKGETASATETTELGIAHAF